MIKDIFSRIEIAIKSIYIGILLMFVWADSSQAQIPKNSVYMEFLGPGSSLSLNYERLISINEKSHLGANIGFGLLPFFDEKPLNPITMTYNSGKNNRFLETGIGYSFRSEHDNALHFVVGYKRLKSKGLLYKFRFTPFLTIASDEVRFLPWMGIVALGYSF